MDPKRKNDRLLDVLAGRVLPAGREEREIAGLGAALRRDRVRPGKLDAGSSKTAALPKAMPESRPRTTRNQSDGDELPEVDDELLGPLPDAPSSGRRAVGRENAEVETPSALAMEMLAGRMDPVTRDDLRLWRLGEALRTEQQEVKEAEDLAAMSLAPPPVSIVDQEQRRVRAKTVALNWPYLCESSRGQAEYPGDRMKKPIPLEGPDSETRRETDLSFLQEKISRSIYILLLADWDTDEIHHPMSPTRSILAMKPRPILRVARFVLEMLMRDAWRSPGNYPLEVVFVGTMAERRDGFRSRLARLRAKIHRSDFVLADLGSDSVTSRGAIELELAMASMAEDFDSRGFLINPVGKGDDVTGLPARIHSYMPSDVARWLWEPFEREMYTAKDRQDRRVGLGFSGPKPDLSLPAWIVGLYLQLRITASARNMITLDSDVLAQDEATLRRMGYAPVPSRRRVSRLFSPSMTASDFSDD